MKRMKISIVKGNSLEQRLLTYRINVDRMLSSERRSAVLMSSLPLLAWRDLLLDGPLFQGRSAKAWQQDVAHTSRSNQLKEQTKPEEVCHRRRPFWSDVLLKLVIIPRAKLFTSSFHLFKAACRNSSKRLISCRGA